jgi:MFS family permease
VASTEQLGAPAAAAQRRAQPTVAGLDARVAVALAFAGSGCLLILEIVAGRLLAPTVGVSLYTWTSVIGVVLGGVSLGNAAGGRIADRWPTRSAVAVIYVAASLASFLILLLVRYASSIVLPSSAPTIVQVLWITGILFFVPSTIMAAATPVLTRLSLHAVEEGGRVVGRIQSAAALGSIVGAFLTGFVLISAFGTRRIVAGVAVTLLLLALAARPPWLRRRVYELAALLAVLVAAGWTSSSGCLRETNYYCIRVEPVSVGAVTAAGNVRQSGTFEALYLDKLLHGVVDLSDPRVLFYPYEQLYAETLRRLHPAGSRVDSFFVGGGAYTFPRWMQVNYRGRILVAEIDPAVTHVARQELGLARFNRVQTLNEDARLALSEMASRERFDVVLGDGFDDFEVPFQLTTAQFDRLVARHLTSNGLYLNMVIDAVRFDFLRSEVRTLRTVFPYVGLMAVPGYWPLHPGLRQTYVVVAGLHRPRVALPTVPQNQLDAFVRDGHSVVLTDDHAPVDQLLAPVFNQALHG